MGAISYIIRNTLDGQYLKEQADGYVWGQGKKGAAMFDLNNARKISGQLQKAGFSQLKLYTVTGGIKSAESS